MDGGRRHRAAGVEPARQRDLTRRPDRQGERRGLSQAEVDGYFLREDELSPIPAPPHLAARQYSARRDRHERTPDPTHKGQATVISASTSRNSTRAEPSMMTYSGIWLGGAGWRPLRRAAVRS